MSLYRPRHAPEDDERDNDLRGPHYRFRAAKDFRGSHMCTLCVRIIATAVLAIVLAAACGGNRTSQRAQGNAQSAGAKSPERGRVTDISDFSPERFGNSAVVDNRWLPLKPGS